MSVSRGISILSLLTMALANLRINWFRSTLTVTGMVFGTAAVIATLSSNEGAKKFVNAEMKKLGTNVVTISASDKESLVDGDLEFVKSYMNEYKSLAYVSDLGNHEIRANGHIIKAKVFAVEHTYFQNMNLPIWRGRVFHPLEASHRRMVGILGYSLAKNLFGERYPVGSYIHFQLKNFTVGLKIVGSLREKGLATGSDPDNTIFIPRQLVPLLKTTPPSPKIFALLQDENKSQVAREKIKALLASRLKRPIVVVDAREAIEKTKRIWENQNLIGIILASICLLTGGVGIMNVMLISIHQRRKEIGLRKAIGAKNRDIGLQFLLEAVVVCLVGGLIGIVVGVRFGSQVAKLMGQWEAETNFSTIGLAIGFSILTGVFFGLLPAKRAAKMPPADALRSA